ncbi:MAG: HEAT repeat domain-containing protein [Acidimicrobiales bacterium]
MPLSVEEAIDQLRHSSSGKRRAAAKRLRSLADPSAGPALLEALQVEATDPRTWEPQYQMAMALGTCGHAPAAPLLDKIAGEQAGYTMLGVGVGDALVRIEWATDSTLATVERLATPGNPGVTDGVFRALAMLRLVPDDALIERILDLVESLDLNDPLRFWVAAAAAGWLGPRVEAFLSASVASTRSELSEVATKSLTGTYSNHRVL